MLTPTIQSFLPQGLQLGQLLQQRESLMANKTEAFSEPTNGFNAISPVATHAKLGLEATSPTATNGFNRVITNQLQQVNQVVQQPDALLKQLMSGGNVDIHDVMLANTKAELAVTLASQLTTKIVQAYERVSQIQV